VISIKGWTRTKVKDICDLGRGRVISSQEIESHPGIYPVFSSQSQNNGEMGRVDTYAFDGEYVTWTTDGAYAGTTFYRTGKFNCTNVCGTLKAKNSHISMRFLAYQLSTLAKNYVSYVGNPKLMNNVMANIELSLPELPEEQTQIAAVLSTVDRAIAQTEAIIAKQQRIKTGLMQDLLTKGIDENGNIRSEETHEFKDSAIGRIPVEWEVVTLNDISTKITDGDHHTPKRSIEGIFLLSARNILNGSLNLSDVDYVSESEYQRMIKRCYPEAGDIFISCSGTIGRICEVPVWMKCVLVRSAALVKLDKSKIQSRFSEWILRSDLLQAQIQVSQRQAAQPNLFQSEIASLNFAKPILYEQAYISKILDIHQSLVEEEILYLEKLKITKTGLMQDLLTGKVRVTEILKDPEVVSL
jgi:type I restriction enzyme, S subunit